MERSKEENWKIRNRQMNVKRERKKETWKEGRQERDTNKYWKEG